MDIRQLRYFIAIVESGSVSEAARRLHVVQPAVSQRLADLEGDLGVQLLVRGKGGIALTEAGSELYKRATLILKQIASARVAVKETQRGANGPVSVGLLRTDAAAIAAPLFIAIREQLPLVVPDIVVGNSEELLAALHLGRLDMAMQVLPPSGGQTVPLFTERLSLVGKDHFFPASGEQLRLDDLRGIPLLLRTQQPGHRALINAATQAGVDLSIVGGIEDVNAALDVCEQGIAATVLPESAAGAGTPRRHLTHRPLGEPAPSRRVGLVFNPTLHRTEAITAVEAILSRMLARDA